MLKKCRACNKENINLVYKIKNIPINIWPKKRINKNNLKDLSIHLCSNCGQIQLQKISKITIEKMYSGKTYNFDNRDQIKDRLKLIKSVYNFNFKTILDVGGGTNPIIENFKQSKKWICDYKFNKNINKNEITTIKGDFKSNKIKKKFDYIFLFHTLEHFEETNSYIKKIYSLLNENGTLIIEVPNIKYDLNYNPYYVFFHMHITIFDKISLINMLLINNFTVHKLLNKGEVLLISFKKNFKNKKIKPVPNYKSSKKLISKYISKINKINKYFNNNKFQNITIFGAGGSTSLLIHTCYNIKKNLKFIVDNDKTKQNLFLFDNKVEIKKPSNKIYEMTEVIIILNTNHIEYIPRKYRNKTICIFDISN